MPFGPLWSLDAPLHSEFQINQRNVLHCAVLVVLSWTGNENIHLLTSGKRQRLRIELKDFEGNIRYAEYDNFKVGSENTKYKLISVGTYSGNAGQ